MASGSVSAAIKDPAVAETFSVIRRENPAGIVFANLGAHHDLENAKRAVDLLEANHLQIHANAPQEILMPEGDRDFSNWLTNIRPWFGRWKCLLSGIWHEPRDRQATGLCRG